MNKRKVCINIAKPIHKVYSSVEYFEKNIQNADIKLLKVIANAINIKTLLHADNSFPNNSELILFLGIKFTLLIIIMEQIVTRTIKIYIFINIIKII